MKGPFSSMNGKVMLNKLSGSFNRGMSSMKSGLKEMGMSAGMKQARQTVMKPKIKTAMMTKPHMDMAENIKLNSLKSDLPYIGGTNGQIATPKMSTAGSPIGPRLPTNTVMPTSNNYRPKKM